MSLSYKRVPLKSNHISGVMPALVAGIHVFLVVAQQQDVDGRDKPGHDSRKWFNMTGKRL